MATTTISAGHQGVSVPFPSLYDILVLHPEIPFVYGMAGGPNRGS